MRCLSAEILSVGLSNFTVFVSLSSELAFSSFPFVAFITIDNLRGIRKALAGVTQIIMK